MTMSDEVFQDRVERVAAVALADVEPGEAILLMCSAIGMISRAARLSDRGTCTAVDIALHHVFRL